MLTDNPLFKYFCKECDERIRRVNDVVNQHPGIIMENDVYNKIHQEYDSLSGAARAVNAEVMENFYRQMAHFIRHLGNKLPDKASKEEDSLMRKGIAMSGYCNGDIEKCMVLNEDGIRNMSASLQDLMK
jgi:hypothetical protein